MADMRIAISQMCSGTDPARNAADVSDAIETAAKAGADIVCTPEMTGMVDRDRARAAQNITVEAKDQVLRTAQIHAKANDIWVALGSLALLEGEGKWANRSFLISSDGEIAARYDKIHLFDVDLASGESWKESSVYRPGKQAVVQSALGAEFGLSICYDIRFASLYTALTNAGANVVLIPAAFTVPTGKAHWEILLRARAIESGAYIIAAAQSGSHEDGRTTYGHSMVIDPWGDILLDMGQETGIAYCDINLTQVRAVRGRIPAVANRRSFALPANRASVAE